MAFDLEGLEKDPRELVYELDESSGKVVQKLITYKVVRAGNDISIIRDHEQIVLPREQFERESEAYHQETMRQIRERGASLVAEFA